jgi:hypothetical protein
MGIVVPLGHIDVVTSSGFVEGWGFDEQRPDRPLLVSVVDSDDEEVALGFANHYRRDLAEARHACGWCHFRLRLTKPISLVRAAKLKLVAKISQDLLYGPQYVQYIECRDYVVSTITDLIAADPTVLYSMDQIDRCDEIFDKFIQAQGVEAFVRVAYIYVLGRSIDAEGLILYNRLIRQRRLTPCEMLQTLAASVEFRSRPRSLVAPTSASFPFRTDP